jgi:type IV pilus assembly protein PilB
VARLRIGELLVEARVISQAQLDEALHTKPDGQKLGAHLVEQGLVSEAQLTQLLSQQLSVPWVSLYHIDFSRELLNKVPRELAERFAAVPIFVRHVKKQGNSLYVAMDDPTNEAALEEIARAAGLPVKPMIACLSDIRSAIRVYYAEGPDPTANAPVPPTTRDPRAAPPPPPPPPAATRPAAPPLSVGPPPTTTTVAHPPPAPRVGRPPLPTVVDTMEILSDEALAPASSGPASVARGAAGENAPKKRSPSMSEDSPDAEPELEVKEYVPKSTRKGRPRMVSLTMLDGSTLNLPATRGKSRPDPQEAASDAPPSAMSDQLTARDLVSALRAVAHGADASEVLGQTNWQAMFAALLSLMLKKNLIADWEFVEELRKI